MTMITHLAMIEMIDIHTKDQDIMRTYAITINKGMMTIDNLIVGLVTIDRTIIGDSRPLDNSNIILKLKMTRNHTMFNNHDMRTGNQVDRQLWIREFLQ